MKLQHEIDTHTGKINTVLGIRHIGLMMLCDFNFLSLCIILNLSLLVA